MTYRPMQHCAAAGCEADATVDAWLERISPKGGPFVGLCAGAPPNHYSRGAVTLRPEAVELLAQAGVPTVGHTVLVGPPVRLRR